MVKENKEVIKLIEDVEERIEKAMKSLQYLGKWLEGLAERQNNKEDRESCEGVGGALKGKSDIIFAHLKVALSILERIKNQ